MNFQNFKIFLMINAYFNNKMKIKKLNCNQKTVLINYPYYNKK